MKVVVPPLPPGLFREAYQSSGEKRLPLARSIYPIILGPGWQYAMLAFAYLSLFDDEVDEDHNAVGAAAVFDVHRSLAERIYGGETPDPALPLVQRIGACVFHFDRVNGAPIRRWLEEAIGSMAVDIARRGKVLPQAELDANLYLGNCAVVRGIAWFAAPGLELPEDHVRRLCDAYRRADLVMDLKQDLAAGLYYVPAEDPAGRRISEDVANGVDPLKDEVLARLLAKWARKQAAQCEKHFDDAGRARAELPSWRVRLMGRIMLVTKRRKFRRFLAQGSWPLLPQTAA